MIGPFKNLFPPAGGVSPMAGWLQELRCGSFTPLCLVCLVYSAHPSQRILLARMQKPLLERWQLPSVHLMLQFFCPFTPERIAILFRRLSGDLLARSGLSVPSHLVSLFKLLALSCLVFYNIISLRMFLISAIICLNSLNEPSFCVEGKALVKLVALQGLLSRGF